MANIPTIEAISSPARTHLPSSRCPTPGTSQPASSTTAGETPLPALRSTVLPPATTGTCTFVVIQTHHTSLRAARIACSKSAPAPSARINRLGILAPVVENPLAGKNPPSPHREERKMTQPKIASARTALQRIALLAMLAGLSTFAAAQTMPAPTSAPAATAAAPTQPPPMNGIAHIAIRVQDIAASLAFYNKLGFQQAFANTGRDGKVSQSFLKLNDKQFIELYPLSAQNPTQNTSSFLHLCFEGADLNALHDYYVAEGLAPISVRMAAACNLLFTLQGPQQPVGIGPQNIEYTQYMPGSRHTLDFGQHLSPDRVADKMTVVALAMQDPAAA